MGGKKIIINTNVKQKKYYIILNFQNKHFKINIFNKKNKVF